MTTDSTAFSPGTRVKVRPGHDWAHGAFGTIAEPPNVLQDSDASWGWLTKSVKTLKGERTFYWVRFDTPQHDADGDGPYSEGAIDMAYLEHAEAE